MPAGASADASGADGATGAWAAAGASVDGIPASGPGCASADGSGAGVDSAVSCAVRSGARSAGGVASVEGFAPRSAGREGMSWRSFQVTASTP